MKKKSLFIALGMCMVFGSTVYGAGPRVRLRTTADSVSYYLGIYYAEGIFKQNNPSIPINKKALLAAFEDVSNTKKSSRRPGLAEAEAFLNEYFYVRLPEESLKASRAWLAKVERTTPGVQRTESGLLYRIVNQGSAVRAVDDNDMVKVHYDGKFSNGTIFDSSRERGEPSVFRLNGVIKGWTEGMKLVGKGGTIHLWIPSELAYGENSTAAGTIPPNTALFFEVELLDINPEE